MAQGRALPGQALDQQLDAPTAGLVRIQRAGEHARVVEHQQVARREQPRQIPEHPVVDPAIIRTVNDEQAAGARSSSGRLAISSWGSS
jgi:hypothetical protein